MDKQQRLFRLASTTNDGVFSGTFNEDIQIAPGSEIALQSAAFDRQSQSVSIDAANQTVKYGLLVEENGITNWEAPMPSGTYTQLQDGDKLLEETAASMNRVISMDDKNVNNGGYPYSINKGSQWRAQLDRDGKTEIACKTQYPCAISDNDWSQTTAAAETTKYAGVNAPTVTAAAGALDYISRPTGGTGTADEFNESLVYGKLRMCKGTGCIRMRLAEIAVTTTGAGVCATMGLVDDLSKLTDGTVADADIKWGLQVCGTDSAYRFKEGAAGAWANVQNEADPPQNLTPKQFTRSADADNANDVLEIIIGGAGSGTTQEIKMKIHRDGEHSHEVGGATRIDPEASVDWYWFISFHQPAAAFSLDKVEADIDPYLFTQDPLAAPAQQSTIDTVIRGGWGSAAVPRAERQCSFTWGSPAVGAWFGFGLGKPALIVPQSRAASAFYQLVGDTRAEFSITAKCYLVLFDELPLDSYDSYSQHDLAARNANSGGSRRNILATVPVKEDQLGTSAITQIAFEPNTLDFIAINNRSPIITRSLKCRILTSTYEPIQVDGMSSLTLLIR